MKTIEKFNEILRNGYSIECAIENFYYLVKNNEDGTTKTIWMDSACEDAYELEPAIEIAYDMMVEDLNTPTEYTFIGKPVDGVERITITTDNLFSDDQALKKATDLLGNYHLQLEYVDIYVGNDFIDTVIIDD